MLEQPHAFGRFPAPLPPPWVAVPTGAVTMFAAATIPEGWLECDGSTVSRSQYKALFDVIGTTWGSGNSTTTFGLPDLRGRAPIGVGTGTGLTARALADTVGVETYTLLTSEMPAHTHTLTVLQNVAGGTTAPDTGVRPFTSLTTSSTGGGGAHQNMQPSVAIKFMIKT